MYDFSRKECVFTVIIESRYLSVCQRVDVSGLLTVWCKIIGGWDCDKIIGDLVQQGDSRCVSDLVDASLGCCSKKLRLRYSDNLG